MDGKGLPMRCLRASRPRSRRGAYKITALCTPEQFLKLAREASRRPGGERSGPGRQILFFVH